MELSFLESLPLVGTAYLITIGLGLQSYTIISILRIKKYKLERKTNYGFMTQLALAISFLFQGSAITLQNIYGISYLSVKVGGMTISATVSMNYYWWLFMFFILGIIIGHIIIGWIPKDNKPSKKKTTKKLTEKKK